MGCTGALCYFWNRSRLENLQSVALAAVITILPTGRCPRSRFDAKPNVSVYVDGEEGMHVMCAFEECAT